MGCSVAGDPSGSPTASKRRGVVQTETASSSVCKPPCRYLWLLLNYSVLHVLYSRKFCCKLNFVFIYCLYDTVTIHVHKYITYCTTCATSCFILYFSVMYTCTLVRIKSEIFKKKTYRYSDITVCSIILNPFQLLCEMISKYKLGIEIIQNRGPNL